MISVPGLLIQCKEAPGSTAMKKIDKIPEGNPFKVPENYFGEVNKKMILSTVENTTEIKREGWYMKLRPYLALAASVAVLAILTYTATRLFSPPDESLSLSDIPVEKLSETILNDIDLLTLEENAILPNMPEGEYLIDKEAIIDYLMLENIDIDIIHDQL
jgi:hypothetical protein